MSPATKKPSFADNAGLGLTQILLWGGSYFFMAVIADPVVASTHWSRTWVVGALSIAILISGLPAPAVGRLIRSRGGRPVLIGGTIIMAIGLLVVAAASSLPMFLIGWAIIGLGMAGSLYDPLFSAIGQAYGTSARGMITQITLISGFAITICWPASSYLVHQFGWRMACFAYAAAALLAVIPLFWWAIPAEQRPAPEIVNGATSGTASSAFPGLLRVGASFTVASMVMTTISVELLMLLEYQGRSAEQAVALGALVGPSQVVARIVEGLFARRAHPYWSLLASAVCVLLGIILLAAAPSFAWLGIVLYGAGNGMRTIVRGTFPLAVYGQSEYAAVMGRLARPPLIGQAATPLAVGLLTQSFGKGALLPMMLVIALVNIVLALAIYPLIRGRDQSVSASPALQAHAQ